MGTDFTFGTLSKSSRGAVAKTHLSGTNQRIPFKWHPSDRRQHIQTLKYEHACRNKLQNQQMECVEQERYEGRFWIRK